MDLKNHFLIASPSLQDDELFANSVIYICEHTDQGAMGLIINKPSDISVTEICSRINYMMAEERFIMGNYVYQGGPVRQELGFILHTKTANNFTNTLKISDNIMLTTSPDVLHSLGTDQAPKHFLTALGCATWGKNQLEQEIYNGDWLITKANEGILFESNDAIKRTIALETLGVLVESLPNQTPGHC